MLFALRCGAPQTPETVFKFMFITESLCIVGGEKQGLCSRSYNISIWQQIRWERLFVNAGAFFFFSSSQWKIMTQAADVLPSHLPSGAFSFQLLHRVLLGTETMLSQLRQSARHGVHSRLAWSMTPVVSFIYFIFVKKSYGKAGYSGEILSASWLSFITPS